jgi:signal transduction histidine kinase
MVESSTNSPQSADPEALQTEVTELRRQLTEVRAKNRVMWTLLVEITRRLQVSTTAIKAAVSSLLDYEIFWDGSTQHEFLETIDDSVNQGSDLVTLMTLAFKAEASSLEMKVEPHLLQEILSTVLDTISEQTPENRLKVHFPAEGTPVFVDYEYLAVALRLLLEALLEAEARPAPIELELVETQDYWHLTIKNIPPSMATLITLLSRGNFDQLFPTDHLSSENILKVFAASQICYHQNIQLDIATVGDRKTDLRLIIPAATVD